MGNSSNSAAAEQSICAESQAASADDSAAVQSPFASSALDYHERGLPVIPAMQAGKIPGEFARGDWRPMDRWQRYADRVPTENELEIWSSWPGANICLPLGGVSGLVAVDIDMDGMVLQALEFALSGLLVCRKRGAKGYTAFLSAKETPWLGKNDLQSKWNITRRDPAGALVLDPQGRPKMDRAVDIIGYGKQTVLPPSIHPSGATYEWLPGIRLDRDDIGFDLPRAPDDLCERISRALAPFQTEDDRRADRDRRVMQGVTPADSWFRDLNNFALANLPAWVPYVLPESLRRYLVDAHDGYRMFPFWRGVTDAPKVGISTSGIRDFAADHGYTPIDLVMVCRSVCAAEAIDWLQGLLRMPSPSGGVSITSDAVAFLNALDASMTRQQRPAPALGVRPATMPVVQMPSAAAPRPFDPATGEVLEADPSVSVVEAPRTALPKMMPAPDFATRPPGILGDIAQWITESAHRPQPLLSPLGAIAFCAAVLGNTWQGPTGLSSNLYLTIVGPSGGGKDHVLRAPQALLQACGLSELCGGIDIASGAGLISRLVDRPNTFYALDEWGHYLSAMADPRFGGHHREVAKYLLQLSGRLHPVFGGKDYAMRTEASKRTAAYPCVNLLGATTPSTYFDALTLGQVRDGFLGRMLVVECRTVPPKNRRPSLDGVPAAFVDWAKTVRMPLGHGSDGGAPILGGSLPSAPRRVGFADSHAERVLEEFDDFADRERAHLEASGDGFDNLVVRWHELALKLALVAAAAINPIEPRITVEAAEWAVQYVRYHGELSVHSVRARVTGSDFERKARDCLAALIAAGPAGHTLTSMVRSSRAFRKLTPKERTDVLRHLEESREAVRDLSATNRAMCWYAAEFASTAG